MYTAIIPANSQAIEACRKLLSKQRLMWDEEPLVMNDMPALKITVADTKMKLKITRSTKRKAAKPSAYTSEALPDGGYVWHTPRGDIRASFPYDQKRINRIYAEMKSRINRRIVGGFTDGVGRPVSGSISDFLRG